MRVLHVITGLAVGGAEKQLRDVLRHSRCDSEVVALTSDGVLAEEIRRDGTPVTNLGMRANTDLAALPRLVKLIKNGDFDVVHTHLYRACLYGRVAARCAGVPTIVATEHSLGKLWMEGRPINRTGVRALYLAAERLGQMTIAVSPHVLDRLVQWGVRRDRVTVIRNGVDAAAFRFDESARARVRGELGIDNACRVVGWLGRLAETKRIDLLIDAVAELPDTVLLLVGDGAARPALERLAVQRRMADRVIFTGVRHDAAAVLSAMDVFASASPQETFGNALVEASASGLPTVYVHCPALEEMPRSLGVRRVSPNAHALGSAMGDLLRLPSERTSLVPARYCDIARVAAQIDQLYDQMHHGVLVAEGRPV